MTPRTGRLRGTRAASALALLVVSASSPGARVSCSSAVRYYGTWSLGQKAGPDTVSLERRVDEVRGLELHYRAPLSFLVDVLERDGDDYSGRATAFGRTYGRFRLVRRMASPA